MFILLLLGSMYANKQQTRPRHNSAKERNPNILVVICSTNLKLSIAYSAETTYEQVFESIAREHEVPESWSHYDLFLPETGSWLRNMGDLPFKDKHGEVSVNRPYFVVILTLDQASMRIETTLFEEEEIQKS
jgi:hypothetical protein